MRNEIKQRPYCHSPVKRLEWPGLNCGLMTLLLLVHLYYHAVISKLAGTVSYILDFHLLWNTEV